MSSGSNFLDSRRSAFSTSTTKEIEISYLKALQKVSDLPALEKLNFIEHVS